MFYNISKSENNHSDIHNMGAHCVLLSRILISVCLFFDTEVTSMIYELINQPAE